VYDEPATQIAAQDGVPVDRVRKRIERLVTFMREHASRIAMFALVVFAALLSGVLRPAPETTGRAPGTAEDAANPLEQARALRVEALRECAAQAWQDCTRDLDAARELDPDGEQSLEVQKAREAIRAASPEPGR
jgi:hypothetical protein